MTQSPNDVVKHNQPRAARGASRLIRPSGLRPMLALGFVLGLGPAAWAQTLQTPTQDPEPIGAGKVSIGIGETFSKGDVFPVSGLSGNLVQSGLLNVQVGVSSIARRVQLDRRCQQPPAHCRAGPLSTGRLSGRSQRHVHQRRGRRRARNSRALPGGNADPPLGRRRVLRCACPTPNTRAPASAWTRWTSTSDSWAPRAPAPFGSSRTWAGASWRTRFASASRTT